MTARATMSDLISLVRDLIGDPAGTSQTFTDDQIQRSLDIHRWVMEYVPLDPVSTIESGDVNYYTWVHKEGYWESDAELYDGNYNELTPTSSDPMIGTWTFSDAQTSVLVKGKVYDPYGAAADLLEMWAGKAAIEFDVDMDGARMNRSQKYQALKNLADTYRKQQKVLIGRQLRNDLY
jgi:hypothetical protein